ncbi:MAG TPA: carbohydrate-binding protein, partial [Tepidisphaeraceae bacterium]|nr:carbohydrate-binding protein [Tepidisphaeraceae bacterium]
ITSGTVTPPPPPPVQPSVTVQAESATMVGVTRQTTNGGYAGSGYADFGGAGSYVQLTVNRTAAGPTTLKLRYANGGTTDRPVSVAVNGTVVQSSVAMNGTGGWTNWQELTLTLDLLAGNNVIRLTSITSNGVNLDAVTVG